MKTLSGLLLAAALLALTGAASASDKVDVIVVTAKKPAATMLSDMEDEIFAETGDELRSQQVKQTAVAAPHVRIEIPALAPERG
jgi:3-oxoacyl-[acyl-carrier-protein] synthase III